MFNDRNGPVAVAAAADVELCENSLVHLCVYCVSGRLDWQNEQQYHSPLSFFTRSFRIYT